MVEVTAVLKQETPDSLAAAWLEAKAEENTANAKRLAIEAKLVAALGQREEGSKTHTLSSGAKVTIEGKLSYKVGDIAGLVALCSTLPDERNVIQQKPVLDETGVKWIRANDPETWKRLAEFIEVKPAKTSVKVSY